MSEDVGKYCQPLFFIGDKPIVYYLSRGWRPVAFFLILSGYGLSYTYKYKTLNFKGQMNRLAKLYIHYWLILLIFVGIGCFVRPEKYPGTLEEAVLNIVSWKSSYNSETWFLLPYALLALSARYIFKVVDKLGNIISFGFFLFLNLAGGYIISRYVATHIITSNLFSMIIVYIGLSFPFILGNLLFRLSEAGELRCKTFDKYPVLAFFLLLTVFTFKCFFGSQAFEAIYALVFIYLFIHIPLNLWIEKVLMKLGDHSMVMWMTHSFFCYHLFKAEIYSLRYPILIFIGLTVISYLVSIPIMYVARQIIGKMLPESGGNRAYT